MSAQKQDAGAIIAGYIANSVQAEFVAEEMTTSPKNEQDAGAQCPCRKALMKLRGAVDGVLMDFPYLNACKLEAIKALQTPCPLEAERNRLRTALEMFYDKWENGDPCFEDPESLSGPLGNAARLSYEEENEILALIPSRPSLQLGALKVRHATNENLRAALKGAVEALELALADEYWSKRLKMAQQGFGTKVAYGIIPLKMDAALSAAKEAL